MAGITQSSQTSWYEVAHGADLRQGSILKDFLIAKPPKTVEINDKGEFKSVLGKVRKHNVVILSQSCDLSQNKSGMALVAPIIGFENIGSLVSKDIIADVDKLTNFKEQIRRGNQPPLHMLAACELEEHSLGIQIVDFRHAITVSFAYLTKFAETAGTHVRLFPPYREQLSQAFARFFMRVALESEAEISRFVAESG